MQRCTDQACVGRPHRPMRPSKLLVARLRALWNPLEVLNLHPYVVVHYRQVEPISTYGSSRRGRKYHLGRIHYFVQLLREGVELEPISIDNDCGEGRILPVPVVCDGNHRFVAHILTGRATIRAHYSGREDLLRYLEGKRKTLPKECGTLHQE